MLNILFTIPTKYDDFLNWKKTYENYVELK